MGLSKNGPIYGHVQSFFHRFCLNEKPDKPSNLGSFPLKVLTKPDRSSCQASFRVRQVALLRQQQLRP